MSSKQTSDGGSTSYYELPSGATELNDLIEYKSMSFAVGNIFKAAYRLGQKEGAEEEYDLRKIIYFANRRLMQLGKEPSDREKLSQIEVDFGAEVMAKLYQRVDKAVEERLSKHETEFVLSSVRVAETRNGKIKGDNFVDAVATKEFIIPSHREKFLREMAEMKGGSDAF